MKAVETIHQGQYKKGLFSIIVPVLNNVGSLQRCLDSFACQLEENKELIVVDGGSTDGTLELIEKNAHIIARSISEVDNGIYAALNKGILLSRGEWTLFLGSDDFLWDKQTLSNVTRLLSTKLADQQVVYGKVVILDQGGNYLATRGLPWSEYQKKPISYWSFDCQGIFHHRNLFQKHGLFDESFRLCGDQDLLLRELKAADALFLDDTVIAGFTLGGASSLPRNLRLMIHEKKRALSNNGLSSAGVVSQRVMCKMLLYEILRKIFGVTIADRGDRFVRSIVAKWFNG